jgi:RNA polymerase sigma-70 factor (ECF subfamily)
MCQLTNANEAPPIRRDAVDELFAQHYQASLRVALSILRSREDSEDAVQNAYCSAFRSLDGFRGESSFKTWITRIVVNCCLMQLRERRTKRQVTFDEVRPALKSHDATPEALCYLREIQLAHEKAASRLPQVLRDVYVDSVYSAEPFPSTAHRFGLSAAATKSRLFRARRKVVHSFQSCIDGRAT